MASGARTATDPLWSSPGHCWRSRARAASPYGQLGRWRRPCGIGLAEHGRGGRAWPLL